jgi:predicted ATPase
MREAVAYAHGLEARAFELRAATSLARLLDASGRADEGRDLLVPLLEWFSEGHGTADLVTARALLTNINRGHA